MTVHDAYRQLFITLQSVYERREATGISAIVIEHLTGFTNTERIVHKSDVLSLDQQVKFHQIIMELLARKPVQYALREAYWYGMKLYVDEHVLIPRPETEELAEWVIAEVNRERSEANDEKLNISQPPLTPRLLDIGTGSGCIALALKRALPLANVQATDISEDALQVAKRNAAEQQLAIHFSKTDILNKECREDFLSFDYIVSNPPYIAESEAASMDSNVVKYEPRSALFVPDDNPLLFYDVIGSFGLQHLAAGGKLFFEINEMLGNEVAALLSAKGYRNIETRKDMQGKDRMIKAEKADHSTNV